MPASSPATVVSVDATPATFDKVEANGAAIAVAFNASPPTAFAQPPAEQPLPPMHVPVAEPTFSGDISVLTTSAENPELKDTKPVAAGPNLIA